MSVVACKKYDGRVEIAADSAIIFGDMKVVEHSAFVKLAKIGDIILGAVGKCEEAAMFYAFLKTNIPKNGEADDIAELLVAFAAWKKKRQGEYGIDNSYLFVVGGKAFYASGFFVDEITSHMAIGSGREYAFAAMDLGASPSEAIKTACKYNVYCSEPVLGFVA